MLRLRIEASAFRISLVAIAALVIAAIVAGPAEARARKRAPANGWHTGYAAIVVDAKTGKVMHETNADALRHPASLTKIMTLYLLFEQIDSGRLKLDSKLKVSARAADQAPSKLGLDEDDEIKVEDAIKALVTRSANDVAVTIAEAIGGSEENFARLMTRKAQALGMKRTVFKNASGLPDAGQVTTARDLALLGRAIQDRFPRHYRYFAIKSFEWHGVGIRNHNHLLGRIDGLDGIKTGYTRASGFNLVSSVRANNRQLVAVVLGGNTASARDARMRELIKNYLPRAYAGNRTAPLIAAAPEPAPAHTVMRVATTTATIPVPHPGSAEPIRPTPVKTFFVGKTGEAVPPPAHPGTLGILPGRSLMAPDAAVAQPLQIAPPTAPALPAPAAATPVEPAAPATEPATPAPSPTPPATTVSLPAEPARPSIRGGWLIQIGAFTEEREAREHLDQARSRFGAILGKADPYTEKTRKGSTTYFRARFVGLDETGARRACNLLKRSDIACLAMKN